MSRTLKELEVSHEELKQKLGHYEKNYLIPIKAWLYQQFGYGDPQTEGTTGAKISRVYGKVFENGLQSDVNELMEFKKSLQKSFRWFVGAMIITMLGVWGNLITNNMVNRNNNSQAQVVKEVIKELKAQGKLK